MARWVISAPGGPELAPCSKSLDITFACHGPVRHVVTLTITYVNASGAAEVMAWGWGNLCQQLAGKSGRCVVLAKDRVAVRACIGSDENEEASRRRVTGVTRRLYGLVGSIPADFFPEKEVDSLIISNRAPLPSPYMTSLPADLGVVRPLRVCWLPYQCPGRQHTSNSSWLV